MSGDIFTAL